MARVSRGGLSACSYFPTAPPITGSPGGQSLTSPRSAVLSRQTHSLLLLQASFPPPPSKPQRLPAPPQLHSPMVGLTPSLLTWLSLVCVGSVSSTQLQANRSRNSNGKGPASTRYQAPPFTALSSSRDRSLRKDQPVRPSAAALNVKCTRMSSVKQTWPVRMGTTPRCQV